MTLGLLLFSFTALADDAMPWNTDADATEEQTTSKDADAELTEATDTVLSDSDEADDTTDDAPSEGADNSEAKADSAVEEADKPTDSAPSESADNVETEADSAAEKADAGDAKDSTPSESADNSAKNRPAPAPRFGEIKPSETAGGNQLEGYRIRQGLHGTGVGFYQNNVFGADGGTRATQLIARVGFGNMAFDVRLPFAGHLSPQGRMMDLGNTTLSGYYGFSDWKIPSELGLELHFPTGDGAYTWVNQAEELWPGVGLNAVWQGHTDVSIFTALFRASVGLHGAAAYDPFPKLFLKVSGSAALDWSPVERYGLLGEMSVAYWDTSPWELAFLGHADLIPGLRARAGLVFPVGVWLGLAPTAQKAGVRESTLLFDLSMSY